MDSEIVYDERGLVPCVVQDWASGEVLTLAYMNAEALERTRATGELHLWSRSRGELWHKGATSGNTQAVRALRLDCDGDALLALVEPAGPACHTGERTCFHRGELEPGAPHETLPELERVVSARKAERPSGSYTVTLLDDPGRIGEKGEGEGGEGARGGGGGSPTGAGPRRPPTSCTTWRCCCPGAGSRSPTPSGCSMTVEAPEASSA